MRIFKWTQDLFAIMVLALMAPVMWAVWRVLKGWYYNLEEVSVEKNSELKAVTNKPGKQKTGKEEPRACPYKIRRYD